MKLRNLQIARFRGIRDPLELDFGKKCQSMVIFGENGRGKSSVADAWEWLLEGRIEHLAVEGAGPEAYPHLQDDGEAPFVEADLHDPEEGSRAARLKFRRAKPRSPSMDRDLAAIREISNFRVRLSQKDLSDFVLKRKGERYKELARLMGLDADEVPLKTLEKVEKSFQEETDQLRRALALAQAALAGLFEEGGDPIQAPALRLAELGVEIPEDDLDAGIELLKEKIEGDAGGRRLERVRTLREASEIDPKPACEALLVSLERARALQGLSPDQASHIGLLRAGLQQVEVRERSGDCPLCGKRFDGDLHQHLTEEIARLSSHQERLDAARSGRSDAQADLDALRTELRNLMRLRPKDDESPAPEKDARLFEATLALGSAIKDAMEAIDGLALPPSEEHELERADSLAARIQALSGSWNEARFAARTTWDEEVALEGAGELSKQRLATLTWLEQVRDRSREIATSTRQLVGRARAGKALERLTTTLRDRQRKAVEARFREVSQEIGECFSILERTTPGLSDPRLQLIEGSNGVQLLVEFHGTTPDTAKAYLSESQLNSFGLAVFVACLRRFQTELKVVVLDDIVSSFDAAKRGRVIEVLKTRCADFQILLLTHDEVFSTRLKKAFPAWKHHRIASWSIATGPRFQADPDDVARARTALENGDPRGAGQRLGTYLELILGDICQNLRAAVRFSRGGNTLADFTSGVRSGFKNSIGKTHRISTSFAALSEHEPFRNFCSHWKEPPSDFTTDEMGEALQAWEDFEANFRCQESDCGMLPLWSPELKGLQCGCGSVSERKAQP